MTSSESEASTSTKIYLPCYYFYSVVWLVTSLIYISLNYIAKILVHNLHAKLVSVKLQTWEGKYSSSIKTNWQNTTKIRVLLSINYKNWIKIRNTLYLVRHIYNMNNWRSINYTGEYSNQSNFQSKQIIISARECLKFISQCKVINIVMEILYTHSHRATITTVIHLTLYSPAWSRSMTNISCPLGHWCCQAISFTLAYLTISWPCQFSIVTKIFSFYPEIWDLLSGESEACVGM